MNGRAEWINLHNALDVKGMTGERIRMKPNKEEIEEWKVKQQKEKWNEYLEYCREMYLIHKHEWDFIDKNKPIGMSQSRINQITKLLHNDCIVLDNGIIRL